MSKEKYILEYWVDSNAFTEKDLEQKLSKDLEKLDVDFKIKKERDYHVLKIIDDKKNIDACHHHLSFDREEAFRAKDELGDELRLKAYPVLADIETRLRRFITRAMIEVLGFNWWETSTSENIRSNVKKLKVKQGPNKPTFTIQSNSRCLMTSSTLLQQVTRFGLMEKILLHQI